MPEIQQRLADWGLARPELQLLPPGQCSQVAAASDNTQVTVLRLADRLLLSVVNTGSGKKPADLKVKLDLKSLGLTPELPWQEFIQVRDFAPGTQPSKLNYDEGELLLPKVAPGSGRWVGIRRY